MISTQYQGSLVRRSPGLACCWPASIIRVRNPSIEEFSANACCARRLEFLSEIACHIVMILDLERGLV